MQVPATITLNNDSMSNNPRTNRSTYNDLNGSSFPMDIPDKLTGKFIQCFVKAIDSTNFDLSQVSL